MATTKIWKIRGRAGNTIRYVSNPEKTVNPKVKSGGTVEDSLEDVIEYASNGEKTEHRYFVTGLHCSPDFAADQFTTVKKQFNKEGGIVALHAYQSFAEGEVTPEEAHRVGLELAEKLWGDGYQVVVATHLNTQHLHNHFVVNSVSYRDGRRYHMPNGFIRTLQDTSDEICRAHGLSVIEEPQTGRYSRSARMMEDRGLPTRYSVAKEAIDKAISLSSNMREFDYELRKMGYRTQFNPNRKYWTVTLPGWKQPIRLARLGEDYTNEKIAERVRSNSGNIRLTSYEEVRKHLPNGYRIPKRRDKIMRRSGLQKLYLRYLYELGYLPKYKQNYKEVYALLRDDLVKCDQISDEVKLLCREGITTTDELAAYKSRVENRIGEITGERNDLRNEVRRKILPGRKKAAGVEIAETSSELKRLRREIRLIDDIESKSKEREQILEKAEKEVVR